MLFEKHSRSLRVFFLSSRGRRWVGIAILKEGISILARYNLLTDEMPDAAVQHDALSTRIYALDSDGVILYIGKTTLDLRVRKRQHRSVSNTASSRHIPQDFEWIIRELEVCSARESKEREWFYIKTLNPLYNVNRPSSSQRGVWLSRAGEVKLAPESPSVPVA